MISELDKIKCQNSFDLIDGSALEIKTKADLKESLEESLENLNGRNLEQRVEGIARNQFDNTRLMATLLIQFKNMADDVKKAENKKTGWKDVLIKCRWAIVTLGSIIVISAIFSKNIIELFQTIASFL